MHKIAVLMFSGMLMSGCLPNDAVGGAAENHPVDVPAVDAGGQQDDCAADDQSSSAVLTVTNAWAGGYCADVALTNASHTSVAKWTLMVDAGANEHAECWGGDCSQAGTIVTITSPSYADPIPPSGSPEAVGFCALGAPVGTPKVLSFTTTSDCSVPMRAVEHE